MKEHLLTSVRDAFAHYTPQQLPAILDVTAFAASVPAEDRTSFLRDVLNESIDAELSRGLATSKASADMQLKELDEHADDEEATPPSTAVDVFIQWFQVCCHVL
jgi:hypothetical protein